jgi:hypothetical protein
MFQDSPFDRCHFLAATAGIATMGAFPGRADVADTPAFRGI